MDGILDKANDLKKQAFRFVGDQINQSNEEEETEAEATIKKKKSESYLNYRNAPNGAAKEKAAATGAADKDAEEEDEKVPNWKRLVKKAMNKGIQYGSLVLVPFIALVMASFVANDMIVYSKFMRVIFFIFTFFMTYLYSSILIVVLPVYYILRTFYRRYLNSVELQKNPKYEIRKPLKIYAFLPLVQGRYPEYPEYPDTSSITDRSQKNKAMILYYLKYIGCAIANAFTRWFCYDKSEEDKCKLSETQDDYWKSLVDSFADYKTYENQPPYKERIEHAIEALIVTNGVELERKCVKPVQLVPSVQPVEPSAPPLPPIPFAYKIEKGLEKGISEALSETLSKTPSKASP